MEKRYIFCLGMLWAACSADASDISEAEVHSQWRHSMEIYALALNIRGDSRIGDISTDVDIDPAFIMDHIDMGAMLRLEGIYANQWGYYVDYSFMKLSGHSDAVLDTNLELLKGNVDIRQGVLEAKGFKRVEYEVGAIDYMAGIRWWDNDIDAKLYAQGGALDKAKSLDEDWIDYLVGIRWTNSLREDWHFHASVDVGLGSDTDFTSSVLTGVRYQINSWSDLNLAYKSTWVDYDNGDVFAYNTASQGFLVGWAVQF